jgi:O-antigen/teichoic acid export membrane protein
VNSLRNKTYQLLRRSEVFLKTDMVYLVKGGFWLTLVQFAGAITAFGLSVAFARLIPRETYGTYKYVLALGGIIGTFTLSGLGPAITQSVAQGNDASLKNGVKAMLRWSVGIVVVSLTGSLYYFLHHNIILAISLLAIGITSPIVDAASFFSSYLTGKKQFRTLSILNIINNSFPAVCLLIAIFYTQNLLYILSIYFATTTLSICVSYIYTVVRFRPNSKEDPQLIGYAKHLTSLGILNIIADQIDKVIVYHYVGAAELAVYTFAIALPLQIRGVMKGVSPLTMPKFANRPTEEIKQALPGKMFKFLLVNIGVTAVYILVAPWLYHFFFPKYNDAILASQIFALSIPMMIAQLPSTFLQAKKHIKTLYQGNMALAVIKLSTLFLGVYILGFWGVIIARVVYEYIGTGLVYYLSMHSEDENPGQ